MHKKEDFLLMSGKIKAVGVSKQMLHEANHPRDLAPACSKNSDSRRVCTAVPCSPFNVGPCTNPE